MKLISERQAQELADTGYIVEEDRDNFDYLYSREELSKVAGRKFHKKKNLVNYFTSNFQYEGKPLLEEYREEALELLRRWRDERDDPGDYEAAKQALEKMWDLQLCGGIYYVDGKAAGYSLGEELAQGKSFVIHFEKAVNVRQYKGLYQFISQAFASILPEKYYTINREQDLGNEGLRHAKASYNPIGFVKKYRAKVG